MFGPVIWLREELGIALLVIPHRTSPISDFTTPELPKPSMNAFMALIRFPCFKFQDWRNEMEISKPTCLPRQSIRMLKNHSALFPRQTTPNRPIWAFGTFSGIPTSPDLNWPFGPLSVKTPLKSTLACFEASRPVDRTGSSQKHLGRSKRQASAI